MSFEQDVCGALAAVLGGFASTMQSQATGESRTKIAADWAKRAESFPNTPCGCAVKMALAANAFAALGSDLAEGARLQASGGSRRSARPSPPIILPRTRSSVVL